MSYRRDGNNIDVTHIDESSNERNGELYMQQYAHTPQYSHYQRYNYFKKSSYSVAYLTRNRAAQRNEREYSFNVYKFKGKRERKREDFFLGFAVVVTISFCSHDETFIF